MKLATYLAVFVFLLFTALSASSQEIPAPNISGTSVQGTEFNLNEAPDGRFLMIKPGDAATEDAASALPQIVVARTLCPTVIVSEPCSERRG